MYFQPLDAKSLFRETTCTVQVLELLGPTCNQNLAFFSFTICKLQFLFILNFLSLQVLSDASASSGALASDRGCGGNLRVYFSEVFWCLKIFKDHRRSRILSIRSVFSSKSFEKDYSEMFHSKAFTLAWDQAQSEKESVVFTSMFSSQHGHQWWSASLFFWLPAARVPVPGVSPFSQLRLHEKENSTFVKSNKNIDNH